MSNVHWLKSLLPNYWIQLESYSAAWDKRLNLLLDTEHFTNIQMFTAEIGGVEVWIGNHPYGSFCPHTYGIPKVRPRRATIARAYEHLMNDAFALESLTEEQP